MNCTTNTCFILLNYVIPCCGITVGMLLMLSPMKKILRLEKDGLGAFNPLPVACMFLSPMSWSIYGLHIQNPFVYWPNVAGALLGLFYTLKVIPFASRQQNSRIIYLLVSGFVIGKFISYPSICILVCLVRGFPSLRSFGQEIVTLGNGLRVFAACIFCCTDFYHRSCN